MVEGPLRKLLKSDEDINTLPLLWMYADVYLLEAFSVKLDKSLAQDVTEKYIHMIKDHLLVDDIPNSGLPKRKIQRWDELVSEAERHYEQGNITEYKRTLTIIDGSLTGTIQRLMES